MEYIFNVSLTKKEKVLGWCVLFVGFMLATPRLAVIILFTAYNYLPQLSELSNEYLNIILNLMIGLINSTLILIVLRKFLKDSFIEFKSKKIKDIALRIFVYLILVYCFNILSGIFISLFTEEATSGNQEAITSIVANNYFLMGIQICILAPFVEEVIFRGVVFRTIRTYNKQLAFLVSSLLFGFIHVQDYVFAGDFFQLIYLPAYAGIGFVFSLLYERNGNIFYSILLHAVYNSIAFVVMYFS